MNYADIEIPATDMVEGIRNCFEESEIASPFLIPR
jgi:hypothetical protein